MSRAAVVLVTTAGAMIVAGLSGCADYEEPERTHGDAAIEFFDGLEGSGIFFRVTAESNAPESLRSLGGPCEHSLFGQDPRPLLEAALTEEELEWVCEPCETLIYEASPRDVSFESGVVAIEPSLVECQR